LVGPRKMHLVAYLKTGPTASYASAWRHPAAPLHDIWDPKRYEHLAQTLEAAWVNHASKRAVHACCAWPMTPTTGCRICSPATC